MQSPKVPLTKTVSDPKLLEDARLLEEIRSQERMSDWRFLLGIPQGRRVLWEIMARCGVFESVMRGGKPVEYNAGRQDLGQEILRLIDSLQPESLILMMQESQARQATLMAQQAKQQEDQNARRREAGHR